MKIEIKHKINNGLLSRDEIEFEIKDIESTPSRVALRQAIANALKVQDDCIVIQRIEQHFGSKNAKCIAHIYQSKQAMETTELRHKIDKSFGIKRSSANKQATSTSKAEEAKEQKK